VGFLGGIFSFLGGFFMWVFYCQPWTQGMRRPCVMDIKIGARTYGPDASPAKVRQEDAKYLGTKKPLGMQRWNSGHQCNKRLSSLLLRAISQSLLPADFKENHSLLWVLKNPYKKIPEIRTLESIHE
jgi:hypothetical protein